MEKIKKEYMCMYMRVCTYVCVCILCVCISESLCYTPETNTIHTTVDQLHSY